MPLTTAVTDTYRTFTNQFIDRDWTHSAGVYTATLLATAVWTLYLLVALENSSGTLTYTEFNPGLREGVVTGVFEGLLIGAILSPIAYAVCWLVTRRWPSVRAVTAALGVLVGPGLLSVIVGRAALDNGLAETLAEIGGAPTEAAVVVTVFFGAAAVLAVLVGGTYTLATGIAHPSRRQQRALVVVAAVLVAVPLAVGAAVPMDDGAVGGGHDVATDRDSAGANDTDSTAAESDPVTDANLHGGAVTDPATYDNGELSPFVRSIRPLEGETDAVTVAADPRPPTPNETSWNHPIAATHTDPNATVSNVNATVNGETVVPKARYHLDFEGVNTSFERVIGFEVYGAVEADGHNDDVVQPDVWAGAMLEADDGFYVEMERTESTHVYADVVTDGGEIHRYVVKLEREDVSSAA